MDNYERRKYSQPQMRPIARNLKVPAPPKFTQEKPEYEINENSNPTFKSNIFVYQTEQKVRISHYEKGVHMFYVQLESLDSQLQALLSRIQCIKLVNLKNRPQRVGMACLARHQKKIHRVAIAKFLNDPDSFLCSFVDYGYSANVKLENLFYIPEIFLNHPTFAIQFTFAKLQNITFKCPMQEVNAYFKEITENRLLSLKCVPIDGPPICQYCELYDAENNILDVLRDYNSMDIRLPEQEKLQMNKELLVKVCYVQSVKEFYIHLQTDKNSLEYDMMYDDLQKQLPTTPTIYKLRQDQYVGVVIESEWYRGKVIDIGANKLAHVEIIDFGIVEEVHINSIHLLPNKFMHIPPFAYRCCLEGFETSGEISENITTQFEMFCSDVHDDRKMFKMNIDGFNAQLGYLAKLDDVSVNPPANVNRILLKNSRPLAETITLENARKRHKETQKKNKDNRNDVQEVSKEANNKMNEKNRSNSQRGRANQVGSRGVNRSSPPNNNNNTNSNDIANNKRQRTHFDKANVDNNANSIGGTYFKTQKEASVWNDNNKQKSSDCWNQAKNISKEQNSDSDWNDTDCSSKKSQKSSKSSKSKSRKSDNENPAQSSVSNKQKSPPKHEKSPNTNNVKQKSPAVEEAPQKTPEPVKTKQSEKPKDKHMKCGWVSTLISTNEAFVHFEEHIDGLEKILDELFVFYEGQQGTPLKEPKAGMLSAYKSQDGNWYRSEILSVDGELCRLRNREYGNMESVQNRFVRVLDERFQKYGKLVEKAYFNIKPNEPKFEDSKLLKEMLAAFNEGAKELSFKIIKSFKDGMIIDPFDPETKENIIETLITKKKMAVRIDESELIKILDNNVKKEEEEQKAIEENVSKISINSKQSESVKITCDKQEEGTTKNTSQDDVIQNSLKSDRTVAKLTALTSPNDFYLTRVDMLQHFNQFHTDIQILAPGFQPLIYFECGTFCLAQQPFDNLWYRAKIIDSDESIITVLCIDNGKTFSIDNILHMKAMPEQLQQKSLFGIPCSLAVKLERKCEEDATEIMMKMVEKEVEYKTVLATEQMNYVELFYNNESIVDMLIEKNYAQPIEIFQSGSGYTSHINSISDFFVQLEVDQLKLDLIASIMDGAKGKFEKVVDPKVGQIISAKYPEDDGWYRSQIESIENDGFIVKFIDYGNSCVVKEIGVIDQSIAELPAMSKQCTLFKPKNMVSFSDDAEKEFKDITANGETILHVKVVKPGNVTEVELFCKNQNIIDKLAPLCKHESDNSKDISEI